MVEKGNEIKFPIKVDLYTLCWNEMKILPFVIKYWEKFVRKAYVYDNGSDDGSVEFLSQFDWIEVRHFESGGFNTNRNTSIKNNAWKEAKKGDADFVVVCDMDECLFAEDIMGELQKIKDENITIVSPRWVDLVSLDFPKNDTVDFLHLEENIKLAECYPKDNDNFHKAILFNPHALSEINYTAGAHTCKPKGNIRTYNGKNFFTLHLKKLGIDYSIRHCANLRERRKNANNPKGQGIHYYWSDDKIRQDINDCYSKAVKWNKINEAYDNFKKSHQSPTRKTLNFTRTELLRNPILRARQNKRIKFRGL